MTQSEVAYGDPCKAGIHQVIWGGTINLTNGLLTGRNLTWNKENEIMQLFSKLRWQVILIAGLIAAVNPTASQANPAAAKPILEIASPRHDAGTHWEGESYPTRSK